MVVSIVNAPAIGWKYTFGDVVGFDVVGFYCMWHTENCAGFCDRYGRMLILSPGIQ
jgi:hypothetical protein